MPSSQANSELPTAQPLDALTVLPRQASLTGEMLSLPSLAIAARDLPEHVVAAAAEILTGAGLTVATDGPVTLNLGPASAAALSKAGAPSEHREEFFRLTISGDGLTVEAGGTRGALWAAHAVADLCDATGDTPRLPCGQVSDWPDLANRGLFVEDKWGPDRMSLEDWCLVVDRLARMRMNTLGIGLYGCWGGCRYEDQPTEFLMVPVPGHPELKSEKHLRWYSPEASSWQTDSHLPRLYDGDFLGDIVAYGRQRGVTVVPFVNSLGHNTMIPRQYPAVSAKDADGTPRHIGYCLSAPETREFIEGFYGSILDRYYPDGADLFHIQLDEVWPDFADLDDPHRRVDPWCECPQCAAREREQNLQDYIIWLVRMLIDRGVGKVVMWNDQLTRHMDALDSGFGQRLADEGLTDKLILHWWWYSNEAHNDKTRVSIGKELGLSGWVAPMTSYFNWERYSPTIRNIELMMAMCRDEGGEGAVAYSVHDPAWNDHEMLLAAYGWNAQAVTSPQAQIERWARARFGAAAGTLTRGLDDVRQAATRGAVSRCYYYRYSYCQADGPWPRPYPGQVLDALAQMDGDPAADLRASAAEATRAEAAFGDVAAAAGLGPDQVAGARSLTGVAARIRGLASTLAWLLDLRAAAANVALDASWTDACAQQRAELVDAMAAMEQNMPEWLVPSALMGLSPLLNYLDQLATDLAEVTRGERPAIELRWTADWSVL